MPIKRERKEEYVADYSDKLARSQAAYIADYRGLSVAAIGGLRSQLREQGNFELAIAKNTLLRIAFENAGMPVPTDHLEGPTAVLFAFDDPVSSAKALTRYANTSDFFNVKGGVVGNQILDAAGVKAMGELPSRDEIRATLIGTIQGPAQTLFGTITAPMREIAQVLHARSEQGGE